MQGGRKVNKTEGDATDFRYDAAGNMIAKITDTDSTVYVRDASGNVMAIYRNDTLVEQSIYGSNRLGLHLQAAKPGYRTLGHKTYELSNHLGNVLATVRDRIPLSGDSTWAEVSSISDYYPFGLTMPGRSLSDSSYRYGFKGKENDSKGEWGSQNHYDYGFRIYNPTVGKFLSVDPLTKSYPMLTPYQFACNRPIDGIDLDGLEWSPAVNRLHAEAVGFAYMDANGTPGLTDYAKGYFKAFLYNFTPAGTMKRTEDAIVGYVGNEMDFKVNGGKKYDDAIRSGGDPHKVTDDYKVREMSSKMELKGVGMEWTGISAGGAMASAEGMALGTFASSLSQSALRSVAMELGGAEGNAAKMSFKSFNSLDDLDQLFKNKSLANASDDLINKWKAPV